MNYRSIEDQLTALLELRRRPVAVSYRDAPPPGVSRVVGSQPSGCSFWRLAAEGQTFYTVPADHYNCPVGSYTHNMPLPPERAHELQETLTLMTEAGYLKMDEVPGIARLPRTPAVVVYAPLADTPVDPDVVLFTGQPARVMLLQEAAARAGIASQLPLLGRPTCAALPAALAAGTTASSGCIGSRVYTGLNDDELYVVIPGRDIGRIAAEAHTIVAANARLLAYHRARRETPLTHRD